MTPTKRTKAVEDEILRRMADGETLTSICRDEKMPHYTTWRQWCVDDQALDIAHTRARDRGHDAIAERLRETARGSGESSGDVQRDKLIIDTDLKLLAKWDPKRYGDRQEIKLEHGLSDDMAAWLNQRS